MAAIFPSVLEQTPRGEKVFDLYSRMLQERIIFVNGMVEEDMASSISTQLLFLDSLNSNKEISLYINSPGGYVTDGMVIYDTMQHIKAPISTVCMGHACSMGSLLLAAGSPGRRFALPHARIMVHQPSGGAAGKVSDIEQSYKNITEVKRVLNEIYVKHTGKSYDEIEKALDRDNWMNAQEAVQFNLIDAVAKPQK